MLRLVYLQFAHNPNFAAFLTFWIMCCNWPTWNLLTILILLCFFNFENNVLQLVYLQFAHNPNFAAFLTFWIMWTIGLLCKCHVIFQLFTFFHFAVDVELMETVMLNNHNSNIFCPHIPNNFSIVFKTFSFCSFSTYLRFEQLHETIGCVAKVSI